MIIYETNQNFWRDISHLTRSWTMRRILRGAAGVAAFTSVFCVLFIEVWPKEFTIPSTIFSLLGIVLSVLMVFRTNSAYDRWYEGRRLWGTLVNNSRNLAIMIHATFPKEDMQSRKELAILISNFAISLKEHLRKGVIWSELIHFTPEDQASYQTKKHIPNHIASLIHQKVQVVYRSGALGDADMINFKPHMQVFMDVAGACERIKKTPIPFSYSVYIKLLILGYSVMLPFGLIQDFGYFTIPLVTFIFFTFIGIEIMAAEIEEPFGLDCNDLPTGDIAKTITTNVFEILSVDQSAPVTQPATTDLYTKVF
ncbi:bestrophin family protein [Xanthocytophaga agilis]|uniref:Bestrophin family ion channel n=1 Tax=Xanthocytophaga agilis TaxID=3048010 RepID=A0AAE3R1I6_9BACT|nr:bestrophin family ion channel [Xanthocytophaga agilis]MDJ1501395.1 bestrophin family ion channel [Xanthocytophaga agilis]